MLLAKELLDILACPLCKCKVLADERHETLECRTCRLSYPVRDGIPVMLADEALPLDGEPTPT